ncbi:30S ribosomal protein S6 alpha [Hirschfeldia incana]|nr:30S ribosomal protein S6 alpha [Hirschfeldia incana]
MVASSLCLSNSPVCLHSLPNVSSSQPLLTFSRSLRPFVSKSRPIAASQKKRDSSVVVKSQALDFSGTFFEGGFGSDDDPTSPSVSTALEDKPEPQCPPGLRQYETMAVLRPDMSEDERLGLTQKYEEGYWLGTINSSSLLHHSSPFLKYPTSQYTLLLLVI